MAASVDRSHKGYFCAHKLPRNLEASEVPGLRHFGSYGTNDRPRDLIGFSAASKWKALGRGHSGKSERLHLLKHGVCQHSTAPY